MGRLWYYNERGDAFVIIVSVLLHRKNAVKGETSRLAIQTRAVLKFVGINKNGLQVGVISHHAKTFRRTLEMESPEIKDNEVMIFKSAKIPSNRAKVAVYSNNPQIDPIGCCVGVKGVYDKCGRKELANENIDCVNMHSTLIFSR